MSDPKNLWGSLEFKPSSRTPLQILREQAKLLGEATNGVVLGDASMSSMQDKLVLFVVAPVLNDFRTAIVEVDSPLVNPYPLHIRNSVLPRGDAYECGSESDFVQKLGEILTSAEVRAVVARLIQNSQA